MSMKNDGSTARVRPNSRNADLLERAHRIMPGGCLGSIYLDPEVDMVASHGKGSHIFDADGNEYVDYMLGSGPMILGHNHPAVMQSLARLASPSNFFLVNESAVLLAEKIVEAIPCAESVKFSVSGSEATFYALRLARAATKRSKVLKFEGGFHGGNDYALMSTTPQTEAAFPAAVPDSAGIPGVLQAEILVAPFNDLDVTLRIMEANKDDLAAVIVEPQSRLIEPKPGFLEGLREAATRMGAVLVYDEIVTGFRIAYGGAQERYGVVPDLATYGKILGGGFPISCVAGKREIMELCNPRTGGGGNYAFMSGTFAGNVVAATTGLATLNELAKPGTYDRLRSVGSRLRNGMKEIADRLGIAAQTLGDGPLATIAFTREPITDYRSSLKADKAMAKRLGKALIRRGFLARIDSKMYISLAHTDVDIERTLEAVDDSLKAIRAGSE